jgi:site-specific DNA-methyltransferase (adenine-specific)
MDDYMNKIICGNSFDLMKDMPDESVNLVITSPPYFQQRKYTDDVEEIGNEKDLDEYVDRLLVIFKECVRVVKKDGSVIFNLGDKYISGNLSLAPFEFAIKARKIAKLINNITWVKVNPTPRQYERRMVSGTEPFFHFVKTNNYIYNIDSVREKSDVKAKPNSKIGQGYFKQIEESDLTEEEKRNAKKDLEAVIEEVKEGKLHSVRMKIRGIHTMPFGGQEGGRKTQIVNNGYSIIKVPGKKMLKDVLEYPVENIKGAKHPAIYPKEIIEKLIVLTTNEDDVVLDPFMGSGTTALACRDVGRNFIGFELNEEFIFYANQRLFGHTRQIAFF